MADTKNAIKEISEKLEQGVKDVFTSEKFAQYLKTMSRFHKYSTRNTMLIFLQKPDAQLCCGYRKWETEFGRHVKKGERGIKIFAPTPFTIKEERQKLDPDTKMPVIGDDGLPETEEIERKIARFKVISVFDVSQTDGKPLPSLEEDISGDVANYSLFMDALREASPLPIAFEPLPPEKDGQCIMGKKIAIREGMSEIQTVCAVLHEITHARLHDIEAQRLLDENAKPKDRRTEELEAEGVAFTVCAYYGIETGANSFGYIASWAKSRELKELNASLDTIRKAAGELIETIDGSYRGLAKERGTNLSVTADTNAQQAGPQLETATATATANGVVEGIPGDVRENAEKAARATDDKPPTPPPQADAPEKPAAAKPDLPPPDPLMPIAERDAYGYDYSEMLPLTNERAAELFDTDHAIYLLYPDNTEAMAFDREEILGHDGLCGIERDDWARSPVCAGQINGEASAEAALESELLHGAAHNGMFGIYQIRNGMDGQRDYAFAPMKELEALGLHVDRANYQLAYAAPLEAFAPLVNLNNIYADFQGEGAGFPAGYAGRSVSVSDVIVLRWQGDVSAHYVDSVGFKALPSFTGNESQPGAQKGAQTYSLSGNTPEPAAPPPEYAGPTVAELKAEVDAGNAISVLDLAKAAAAERKPAAAGAARPKEKASVLGRLDANKGRVAAESKGGAPAPATHREVQ